MNDSNNLKIPIAVERILAETAHIGFQMVSEPLTGTLLRTLAASKPAGNFLELGTGTGISAAWLLDGMDSRSKLITIENDQTVAAIAQKNLDDPRITFHLGDAGAFLEQLDANDRFDFIFADTWAGKYSHLESALHALKPGGLYVIDDMLPQVNWVEGHEFKVAALIEELEGRQDLILTKLNWASGIVIVTKPLQSALETPPSDSQLPALNPEALASELNLSTSTPQASTFDRPLPLSNLKSSPSPLKISTLDRQTSPSDLDRSPSTLKTREYRQRKSPAYAKAIGRNRGFITG